MDQYGSIASRSAVLSHPGFLLQRTIEDLNGIWFLYLLKFCSFSNCQHHAFLCALELLRPWLMRSTSCWKTLLLCQSSRKRSHPRSQKVHRNCSMDLQCDEHWVFCSWILKNSGNTTTKWFHSLPHVSFHKAKLLAVAENGSERRSSWNVFLFC